MRVSQRGEVRRLEVDLIVHHLRRGDAATELQHFIRGDDEPGTIG
jgi:hypothetical protein